MQAIQVGPLGLTASTRCWVGRLDRLQCRPAPQTALTHTAGGASTRTGIPPAVDWVTNFARPCRAERLFSAHGGAILASEVARAGKPRSTRRPQSGHDPGALREPSVLGERPSAGGAWHGSGGVRWPGKSSIRATGSRGLTSPNHARTRTSTARPRWSSNIWSRTATASCQLPRHFAGPGTMGRHSRVRPRAASRSRLPLEAIQPQCYTAGQDRHQAEV